MPSIQVCKNGMWRLVCWIEIEWKPLPTSSSWYCAGQVLERTHKSQAQVQTLENTQQAQQICSCLYMDQMQLNQVFYISFMAFSL